MGPWHFKYIKHTQHIQRCQSWPAAMIFMKEIVQTDRPTFRRSDHPSDGRTHAHIEMEGPI